MIMRIPFDGNSWYKVFTRNIQCMYFFKEYRTEEATYWNIKIYQFWKCIDILRTQKLLIKISQASILLVIHYRLNKAPFLFLRGKVQTFSMTLHCIYVMQRFSEG